MNIIFDLSTPVDLNPVYPQPLPWELFEIVGQEEEALSHFFSEQWHIFREYFPEASYYVINRGSEEAIQEVLEGWRIISIPSNNLFTRIFFFSSFILAYNLEPVNIFIPAHCNIDPFSQFASALREAWEKRLVDLPVVYYSSNKPAAGDYHILAGDLVEKWRKNHIYQIKEFVDPVQGQKLLEMNQSQKVLYSNNIVSVDVVRFMSQLPKFDERLHELFFLLTDAWKDGQTIQAVKAEVIKELDTVRLEQFVRKIDDRLVVEIPAEYRFIDSVSDLLEFLPVDEYGNYIEGDFRLKNVRDSLLINHGEQKIELENLNSVCGFFTDKKIRVFRG